MVEKRSVQRIGSYAIIRDEDRILLCRLTGGPWHSYWTLPGGGIEFGEHPEKAAVREVYEETGFHVRLGGLRKINNRVSETEETLSHNIQFFYDAEIVGGELTREIDGTTDLVDWFTSDQAQSLNTVDVAQIGIRLLFDS